jgi:hypothetical protein
MQCLGFQVVWNPWSAKSQGMADFEDSEYKASDKGWPEPYIYTVYDRISRNFPAKSTVYTPYIYGSGQPYKWPLFVLPNMLC